MDAQNPPWERPGGRAAGEEAPLLPSFPNTPPPFGADSLFCNKLQAARVWQFLKSSPKAVGFTPSPPNRPARPRPIGLSPPASPLFGAVTCPPEVNKLWESDRSSLLSPRPEAWLGRKQEFQREIPWRGGGISERSIQRRVPPFKPQVCHLLLVTLGKSLILSASAFPSTNARVIAPSF